jgi:hypothetical protein
VGEQKEGQTPAKHQALTHTTASASGTTCSSCLVKPLQVQKGTGGQKEGHIPANMGMTDSTASVSGTASSS